jgi:OOP family OmpA-OmpF porin
MKLKSALLRAAISAALAFISANTLAQEVGKRWYGGASVGRTSADISGEGLTVAGATASSVSKDETGTGFKGYVGYRFNRNFAIEGGYTDLGEFSATRNVTAPAIGSLKGTVTATGLHIDAVGILPLQGNFSLFGKVGAYFNEVETRVTSTGAVVVLAGRSNFTHSDTNLKVGVGAAYDFNQSVGLRVEWERFSGLGDSSVGGTTDVDMLSAGVVFRF